MANDAAIIFEADMQIQLDAIGQAVLDGDIPAAETATNKLLEDVFSGSPTNSHRNFKIINEGIAGIGHTIHSAGENNSPRGRAKRETQRHAFQAVLQTTLEHIQKQKQKLTARLTELAVEHEQITNDIRRTKDAIDVIDQKIQKHKDSINESLEKIDGLSIKFDKRLETFENIYKEQYGQKAFDEFNTNVRDVAKEYITIHYDIKSNDMGNRLHIVWKDENDHFIRDPETGERINLAEDDPRLAGALKQAKEGQTIGTLGNERDEQKLIQFNQGYIAYHGDFTCTPILGNVRTEIVEYLAEIQKLTGEIELDKQKLENLIDEKAALEKDLTSLQENLKINEAEAAEIQIKLDNLTSLEKDLQNSLKQHSSKITQFKDTGDEKLNQRLAELRESLYAAQETLDSAKENHAEIQEDVEKIIETYDPQSHIENRHDLMQEEYGGFFSNWTPNILINALSGLISDDSKLGKAWSAPVTHEGEAVYRTNETPLRVYTFDENGRHYIEDPSTIANIFKQADVGKKFFMNETPNSEDPNNKMRETLGAELKAKDIRDAAEKAETKSGNTVDNAKTSVQSAKNALESALENVPERMRDSLKAEFSALQTTVRNTINNKMPEERAPEAGKLAQNTFTPAASHSTETHDNKQTAPDQTLTATNGQ